MGTATRRWRGLLSVALRWRMRLPVIVPSGIWMEARVGRLRVTGAAMSPMVARGM
jgi:hypothetical protein